MAPRHEDDAKKQTAVRDRLRKLTLALVALDRRVRLLPPGPRAVATDGMRQIGRALQQGVRALESGDVAEAERKADEAQRLGVGLERAIQARPWAAASGGAPPRGTSEADAYMAGQKRCAVLAPAECEATCEAGDLAMCTAMAGRLFDGVGVKADPERAMKSWRQLCKGGYRAACVTR